MNRINLQLVVSGTRDADPEHWELVPRFVKQVFDSHRASTMSIRVGCARGVDEIVRRLFACNVYQAHWDVYGKRAGMMRNEAMIDAAREDALAEQGRAVLLAFPRIGGRGTQGAIAYARRLGVETWEVPCEGGRWNFLPPMGPV